MIHPGYREVTVDQLLTQRGGLPPNAAEKTLEAKLDPQSTPAGHGRRLLDIEVLEPEGPTTSIRVREDELTKQDDASAHQRAAPTSTTTYAR